jgi:hypothetical protein
MKNVTNKDAAIFELSEAVGHLQDLIKEIEEGMYSPDGEYCYATVLRHIYEHLNRSFQYADMEEHEIGKITQESFETLGDTLPDFLIPLITKDR